MPGTVRRGSIRGQCSRVHSVAPSPRATDQISKPSEFLIWRGLGLRLPIGGNSSQAIDKKRAYLAPQATRDSPFRLVLPTLASGSSPAARLLHHTKEFRQCDEYAPRRGDVGFSYLRGSLDWLSKGVSFGTRARGGGSGRSRLRELGGLLHRPLFEGSRALN
jgi:hypothetical protein